MNRLEGATVRSWETPGPGNPDYAEMGRDVALECGWGRLLFAHTFKDLETIAADLRDERAGQRDIAFYVRDPHVILSLAPQELFLDPSHTFRLWLEAWEPPELPPGLIVREMAVRAEADAVNRIYAARNMVQVQPAFFEERAGSLTHSYLVAIAEATGEVVGTVTGIDHRRAFADPEDGSSLWCLAVDPQATLPGVGRALVTGLAARFKERGRSFMDLSVMHDNHQAIRLYEQLGFERVPVFTLKNKNAINEKLFSGPGFDAELNPYCMIIIDEARRRGIQVEVQDAEGGFFRLSHGGVAINCRESLSELTSAVALSRCDDKAVTRRLLGRAGLFVPAQTVAGEAEDNAAFLADYGSVVVKPARGEQGAGVAVDLCDAGAMEAAIAHARSVSEPVLLEQFVTGQDLRIIVIGGKVVAAAVRRPPEVIGNGEHSLRQLIEKQSRRRAAATGGESRIPIDGDCERTLAGQGLRLEDVPDPGQVVLVRKTPNLHTGGTIHDVTAHLSLTLVEAAKRAAEVLDIPVVGLDFLVPDPGGKDYVIIEANERPGLANHEPQPTAERFLDLLFPLAMPTALSKS